MMLMLFLALPLLLHARRKEGQDRIDSLRSELFKKPEDTNKDKLLHAIAFAYLQINPDTGMKYGVQELELAKKLSYKKGIASAYYNIGNTYSIKGDLTEALDNLTNALKLFEDLGNNTGISSCYNSIGLINADQDNYPEALKNYFSALKINEKIGNKGGVAAGYVDIGTIYHYQKSYAEALQHYDMALKIATETNNKRLKGSILVNIANVNIAQENYQEALKNATAALQILTEINDRYATGICYTSIGGIYNALHNYPEALRNGLMSVSILEALGTDVSLASAYGGLGNIFVSKKDYSNALRYFEKELTIGQKVGAIGTIRDANESMSGVYEKMGDDTKALEAYKAFIVARDSVSNEERTKKGMREQMQYDFDKKEVTAKAEQVRRTQQKNVLIVGVLSALIASIIIGLLLIRQTKLKAKQQQIELEQKQLRAQMNPHFIFNCLNSIQHFIVANDIKNANKYLSGFALLMRQTLENSKSGTVTIRTELEYLKNYLSLEWMLFEDKFSYEISCDEKIEIDREEIPSMIIQPFIENAIRHGLCNLTTRDGRLKVSFYLKDAYLICEIDDNGIGREQSQKLKIASELIHESQGMELTRQRLALVSKSIGAEYEIIVTDKKNDADEPAGTTITINFPTNI